MLGMIFGLLNLDYEYFFVMSRQKETVGSIFKTYETVLPKFEKLRNSLINDFSHVTSNYFDTVQLQ